MRECVSACVLWCVVKGWGARVSVVLCVGGDGERECVLCRA